MVHMNLVDAIRRCEVVEMEAELAAGMMKGR